MASNNQISTATGVGIVKADTVDVVAAKVRKFQENGELHFPANYSPENAMKSAWLCIQETKDRNSRPALEVCTKSSIANALLNMVVQGLNPAKKQCYFIVYGNQLTLQRSYFGAIHIAKTVDPSIEDVTAHVVYEDEVESVDIQTVDGYDVVVGHRKNPFRKPGSSEIVGVGFDKSDAILGLIEDGHLLATMAQNPDVMGYEGVKAAVAALNGESLGGAVTDTGVSVLTK